LTNRSDDALHLRAFEPCRSDLPPLERSEIRLLSSLLPHWRVVNDHHLERLYEFPDFAAAMEFCTRVGDLAEEMNHHPDIAFGWGWAEIKIWTHVIDGLHEGDFVMASLIERLER